MCKHCDINIKHCHRVQPTTQMTYAYMHIYKRFNYDVNHDKNNPGYR